MNVNIPDKVKFIIDTFYENNYEAFMVGGCIRDSLLLKDPKDYDIATSATPTITESLFDKTIPTGIKHGTITVLIDKDPFEVTTYRVEGKYKDNRRPDEISFVTDIKDDLSRRDFTINAFAYNSREGLKDYFNGLEDLKNRIIRTVGNSDKRFNEDALRIMRAIRFSAQLNFEIEENTLNAIKKNKELLENISAERIRDELCKILISDNPRKGIILLRDCGVLNIIIPELISLIGFNQRNRYHHEDIFNHTLSVVENTPNNLILRLSALFHDIGKTDCFFIDDDGNGRFFGHNNISEEIAEGILTRLHFDNKTIKTVCILIKEHMNVLDNPSNVAIKRLINRVSVDNIHLLYSLQEADIKSLKIPDEALSKLNIMRDRTKFILESKAPMSTKDLAIDGGTLISELSLVPGKIIGDTLNHILQLVLNNPALNTKETLLSEAKEYIKKV
ncbi:CCA tRNA nucleotidyltransferase, partial [Clostridium sardiniense]|uniref:CCA tRNA nucleotidyltransferase n=1 Tax=Clostridium sardiniense TaxID=29369 RepID=UPI003D33C507